MLMPYQVPGLDSANGISILFSRVGGWWGSTRGIGTRLAYADRGAGIAGAEGAVEPGVLDRQPVPAGTAEPCAPDTLPLVIDAPLNDDPGALPAG